MGCLGFDTSNYTTSIAWNDGIRGVNRAGLLPVRSGELGLRQSDALFAHVKQLSELAAGLIEEVKGMETGPAAAESHVPYAGDEEQKDSAHAAGAVFMQSAVCRSGGCRIDVVAASTRPRAVEGSYMPCFLAGSSQGQVLASVLGVPYYAFSHQQGHLAAVLWGAGRLELLDRPFLAWHLSGGTTELLRVEPGPAGPDARKIGGTTDLAAGQLIDRTGRMLGLDFPAGKALDALAAPAREKPFRVRLQELEFSLSGVENQVRDRLQQGVPAAQAAAFVLDTVAETVFRTTLAAMQVFPGLPVVFSGGVASCSRLRARCAALDAVFAAPALSTDNAMGVAVLGWLRKEGHFV